jgi:hypothetical protein
MESMQAFFQGAVDNLTSTLKKQVDDHHTQNKHDIQERLTGAGFMGSGQRTKGIGDVIPEELIPVGFFADSLHIFLKERNALGRILAGESEDSVINSLLSDCFGTGATFADPIGEFIANQNFVTLVGAQANAAQSDTVQVIGAILGEHAFGSAKCKDLSTAELSKANFPGSPAVQLRYEEYCASMANFQQFSTSFAAFMEETGRRIRPGGSGSSSSAFHQSVAMVGMDSSFKRQQERRYKFHQEFAAMLHSFFTHILSIVRTGISDETSKLFTHRSGAWHESQALCKAKLFLRELFSIRQSLRKMPRLALLAVLAYGQKLARLNWVDTHLDRQSLGAPVVDAGLDKLAAAMKSGSDPFTKVATVEKAVAESSKKCTAMEKQISSLQSDLAKKANDAKTAEEKHSKVLERLNNLDQKVKQAAGNRQKEREKNKNKKKGANNQDEVEAKEEN